MIAFYPVPQLQQVVPTVARGLWGVERLHRGYSGPIIRVRRASDSALQDCYSHAEIVAHCLGTNGFAHTLYDQSVSTSHNLTQATTAKQPKIYDSVTGLKKYGRTAMLDFDGTDDLMHSGGYTALPSGSPAITTALMIGSWTNTGVTAFACGINTGSNDNSCWYMGHSTTTTCFVSSRGSSRTFDMTSPAGVPCYLVVQKAAAADMSTSTCRQNKTLLTQNAVSPGAHAYIGQDVYLGCAITEGQSAAIQATLLANWNAVLAGAELAALEQYLERMRLQ